MRPLQILVLFGGCSTEYSVSLQSAHGVLSHMDPARFHPLPVGITREGRWLYYTGPLDRLLQDSWHLDAGHCTPCTLSLDRGRGQLLLSDGAGTRLDFSAAFPVLHGKNGEDGTVQGLLELIGVPLVGCGALSSALCMDKDRAHKLAALAGVSVPRGTVLRPVLSLHCRVVTLRTLLPGEQAGYGRAFTARRPTTLAVLAIGYADGLPRALAQQGGQVLLHGCRCPMVGRMCMDQLLVDVTEAPQVRPGDRATLIGRSADEELRAEEVAARCGTITNELLSRLGGRLDLIAVSDG